MYLRSLGYGALAALATFLWTCGEYLLGGHEPGGFGEYTGYVGMIFPIVAVAFAIRAARPASAGRFGFATGFSHGVVATIGDAPTAAIGIWAYFTLINPGWIEPSSGSPVDLASLLPMVVMGRVIFGLVTGLIAAAVLRRPAAPAAIG